MSFDPLDHFRVAEGVYSLVTVVGERLLTLKHQQIRAVNLARHLVTRRPKNVCIIGAGLAGLTCAAMLLRLDPGMGMKVLEKHSVVLWNLRGCHTRWLHPHFFTWPEAGWWIDRANVPVLDWIGGPAHRIHHAILEEWDRKAPKDTVLANVRDVMITPGARPSVSWDKGNLDADAVVLAIGPGKEREEPGALNTSYWHADNLDREDPGRAHEVRKYVVAGDGDGALTDVLRLRLSTLVDHESIKDLAMNISDRGTIERILSLKPELDLGKRGSAVDEFEALARRDAGIVKGLRPNIEALIISGNEHPYSQGFLINRYLTAILMTHPSGGVRHHRGYVDGLTKKAKDGHGWVMVKPDRDSRDPRREAHEAPHYVHRIGVDWSIQQFRTMIRGSSFVEPSVEQSARLAQASPATRVVSQGRSGGWLRLGIGVRDGARDDGSDVDILVCRGSLPWSLAKGTIAIAHNRGMIEIILWDEREGRRYEAFHEREVVLLDIFVGGMRKSVVCVVRELPPFDAASALSERLGESACNLVVAFGYPAGVEDTSASRSHVVTAWRARHPQLEVFAPSEEDDAELDAPDDELYARPRFRRRARR